ncbi:MAG: hypothetical protein R3C58_02525 [Parvularculaceae bacterium]
MTNADDEKTENAAPPSGFVGVAGAIGARNLKIAIVAMPLVFIVAVWAVIAIFGPPGGKKRDDAPAIVAASAPVAVAATAPSSAIALKEGEEIRSLTLDGDRLAATVDGPNGAFIVIYDIAKSEEIARIPVARGN